MASWSWCSVGAVLAEHIGSILQQLPFPLADLVGMDAVLAGQFAERSLTFGRFQRHTKLEVGTESSTFLRHLSDPPRTKIKVWFLHLSTWSSFWGQL